MRRVLQIPEVGMAIFLLVLGLVGALDLDSAIVTEAIVEERTVELVVRPGLVWPPCDDQWVAMRGAGERWDLRCVVASTEGSRARE